MDSFPSEIEKIIVLNIDPYTTYESSKVCRKWYDILNEKYHSITDCSILNDTFMFHKFLSILHLTNHISTKYEGPKTYLDEYFNIDCIKMINNPMCIKYLWKLMEIEPCGYKYIKKTLSHICKTNNKFPVKFYEKNGDYINESKLLGKALFYQSYDCVDYLVTKVDDVYEWINYIIHRDGDKKSTCETLDYLVKIYAINLRYFHTELLKEKDIDVIQYIINYIETKYF